LKSDEPILPSAGTYFEKLTSLTNSINAITFPRLLSPYQY